MRSLRTRLGWTQQKLADELGVSNDAVSRWERGEDPISRRTELAVRALAAREGIQS